MTKYLNELNHFKFLLESRDQIEPCVSLGGSILVDINQLVDGNPELMKTSDLQNLCQLLSQCSALFQNPAAVDSRQTEDLAKKFFKKMRFGKELA